jgi:hypothetical protein
MPRVELHPAYFFVCDACGRDSLVIDRYVGVDDDMGPGMMPDVIAQMEEDAGDSDLIDDMGEGGGGGAGQCLGGSGIFAAPDYVQCQHCEAEFEVDHGMDR